LIPVGNEYTGPRANAYSSRSVIHDIIVHDGHICAVQLDSSNSTYIGTESILERV
jgi:hypothetical protein